MSSSPMSAAPSSMRRSCCAPSEAARSWEKRMSVIATIEALEAIYGQTGEASTVKVADRITPSYRVLIEKSPFAALATSGPEGLDCSPRGDLPGFVRIHDDRTLMLPDRRSEEHTSELQSHVNLVCRLLLEK